MVNMIMVIKHTLFLAAFSLVGFLQSASAQSWQAANLPVNDNNCDVRLVLSKGANPPYYLFDVQLVFDDATRTTLSLSGSKLHKLSFTMPSLSSDEMLALTNSAIVQGDEGESAIALRARIRQFAAQNRFTSANIELLFSSDDGNLMGPPLATMSINALNANSPYYPATLMLQLDESAIAVQSRCAKNSATGR